MPQTYTVKTQREEDYLMFDLYEAYQKKCPKYEDNCKNCNKKINKHGDYENKCNYKQISREEDERQKITKYKMYAEDIKGKCKELYKEDNIIIIQFK